MPAAASQSPAARSFGRVRSGGSMPYPTSRLSASIPVPSGFAVRSCRNRPAGIFHAPQAAWRGRADRTRRAHRMGRAGLLTHCGSRAPRPAPARPAPAAPAPARRSTPSPRAPVRPRSRAPRRSGSGPRAGPRPARPRCRAPSFAKRRARAAAAADGRATRNAPSAPAPPPRRRAPAPRRPAPAPPRAAPPASGGRRAPGPRFAPGRRCPPAPASSQPSSTSTLFQSRALLPKPSASSSRLVVRIRAWWLRSSPSRPGACSATSATMPRSMNCSSPARSSQVPSEGLRGASRGHRRICRDLGRPARA